MLKTCSRILATAAFLALAGSCFAEETQTLYLSGKGKDDPIQWDFICNNGMNANKASKINVPSNWELQGFGIYTYGEQRLAANGATWPKVQGVYTRSVTPPAAWNGKKVYLTFEGVMTDTQAFVNDQSAGPKHQGGYYRFRYDVTKLLHAGQENALRVVVDDESAEPSVNGAERRGDYWNYAGIYRPVYLEAVPQQSIERVAVDGRADGTFAADVFLDGLPAPQANQDKSAVWSVEAQILDLEGKPVGEPFAQVAGATTATTGDAPAPGQAVASMHLTGKIASPRLWSAETPNMYQVEFRLKNGAAVVHSVRQKFGFRTLEVRTEGDIKGLYVNGQRIMLKGACRHSFWPDSGRCLSPAVTRDDVLLMKDMNMNAVRCTHYPPDSHFLEACDDLGLYVLDEIGGWHQFYTTPVAHKVAQEFVTHDVNHPSVLFWDNGNEGGFNFDIDDDYAKWDVQKRPVLHPGPLTPVTAFRGIDTKHYPSYIQTVQKCAGDTIYLPTEMLHGLYDGGAGASLEDYWNVMLKSKVSAGGMIWALVDEDVKRTDQGGKLDSYTNYAPDGIVGPYREKEASFYTIKQIWSPFAVLNTQLPADGIINVENRYSFTNLQQCHMTWEYRTFARPNDSKAGFTVTEHGDVSIPSIAPGAAGTLAIQFPPKTRIQIYDALALTAKDPEGHELWTWVFPAASGGGGNSASLPEAAAAAGADRITTSETPDALSAKVGGLAFEFSKKNGQMISVARDGKSFTLGNGPRFVEGIPAPPPPPRVGRGRGGRGAATATASATAVAAPRLPAPASVPARTPQEEIAADREKIAATTASIADANKALQAQVAEAQKTGTDMRAKLETALLSNFTSKMDGTDLVITATYTGELKSLVYRLRPNGWLTIDYAYALEGPRDYFGIGFDLPEASVKSMRYLGNGPFRVWKNRLPGVNLNVWDKPYNTIVTGDPSTLAPGEHFDYPEFKGYYAGVRWLQLRTTGGAITALVPQHDQYVQVLTPVTPASPGRTGVAFPEAGLSFLQAIPPVGSKFVFANVTGPQAQVTVASGEYKNTMSLYFGELPR